MRGVSMLFSSVLLCTAAAALAVAQTPAANSKATLYSANKYKTERKVGCINFETGPSNSRLASCDLRYGSLWAGDDLDWFQSASGQGDRSVIKDLGAHEW